jgi:phosphoesterase RecJ-like protein
MRIAELLERGGGSVSAQRRTPSREQVLEALRAGERFVLTTHEHPDGDALGSLAAMQQVLCALGKDACPSCRGRVPAALRVPLPRAAAGSSPSRRTTSPSARSCSWTAATSTATRPSAQATAARILNIDHHHDNTRFGTINHVVPDASCTAEMVWDLMHGLGRASSTQPIAEALYVGLVTDTGRFMYENTGPRAHEMAAELIDAGSTCTRSTGGSTRASRRASSSCWRAG